MFGSPCLLQVRWGQSGNGASSAPTFAHCEFNPADHAMMNFNDRPAFRPSISTDKLRPALLLAGAQVMIALLGSVLLTNGLLA